MDPATGVVYETEDQGDGSGFYRFVPSAKPTRPGDLAVTSGVLQMLKVVGMPGYETAINQTVGVALPVEWVTIRTPIPPGERRRVGADPVVGVRRRSRPAAHDSAARGMLEGTGGFSSSRPTAATGDLARCGSTTSGVDPHLVGGVAEPRCIRRARQRLRHPAGRPGVLRGRGRSAVPARGLPGPARCSPLARNLRNSIEFAGACFSPDGRTLFANLYGRSTERTTQPYRSPVQIPVGPEKARTRRHRRHLGPVAFRARACRRA